MKYVVKGASKSEVTTVTLTKRDYLARGGEKQVFVKGDVAYGIYHNPSDATPSGKIQELSVLEQDNIIKPEFMVLDDKGRHVGETMRFVSDALELCRFFPKAFRLRNGLTNKQIIFLVHRMHDTMSYVHSNKILIVDNNEMNWLVSKLFDEVYAIDVNNWKTPSYRAKVLVDNIRDRHMVAGHFNEGTDWFSAAILFVQMIVGIHPYKGNHPDFMTIPPKDRLDERMKANVSIFTKQTVTPKSCESLRNVPAALCDWLVAVLEKGVRTSPPDNYEAVTLLPVASVPIESGTHFVISKIGVVIGNILLFKKSDVTRVILTNSATYIGDSRHKSPFNCIKNIASIRVGFTQKTDRPIAARVNLNRVELYDLHAQKTLDVDIAGSELMESDGRLYVVCGRNVMEIVFNEYVSHIGVSVKVVGQVLDIPNATQIYTGCIIQNVLGRHIVSVFPEYGTCYQLNLNELDSHRVIDAKYENGVLVLIGEKKGKYDRFVFCLSKDFESYDVRVTSDIVYTGINFTATKVGVAVLIDADEIVEIWSVRCNSKVQRIDDPAITGDMQLAHDGSRIMFYRGSELYRLATS